MSAHPPRPAPRTLVLILLVLTVLSWGAAVVLAACVDNLGNRSLVLDADHLWMRLVPWLPLAGVHVMAFVGVARDASWARLLPVSLGVAAVATATVQSEPGVAELGLLVPVAAVPLTAAGILYARRTPGPLDLAGAVAPLIALFPSLVFAGAYIPSWFPPPGSTLSGCLLGAITAGLAATRKRGFRILLVLVAATPLALSGFVLTMNHLVPRMFETGPLAGHAVMVIASLGAIVAMSRRPRPVASGRVALLAGSLILVATSALTVALSPHVRPTPGEVDTVCPRPDGTIDVYFKAPPVFSLGHRYRRDRKTGAAILSYYWIASEKRNPEIITRLRYDQNLTLVSRERVEATPAGMFCGDGRQREELVTFLDDRLLLDGPNRMGAVVPLPGRVSWITWGAVLPRYLPVSLRFDHRAAGMAGEGFAIVDTETGRLTQLCESRCERPSRPYCRYGYCLLRLCNHGDTIMDGSAGRPVVSIDAFGALRPGGVTAEFGSGIVDLDFETRQVRATISNRTSASAAGSLAPTWRDSWEELGCQPPSASQ